MTRVLWFGVFGHVEGSSGAVRTASDIQDTHGVIVISVITDLGQVRPKNKWNS